MNDQVKFLLNWTVGKFLLWKMSAVSIETNISTYLAFKYTCLYGKMGLNTLHFHLPFSFLFLLLPLQPHPLVLLWKPQLTGRSLAPSTSLDMKCTSCVLQVIIWWAQQPECARRMVAGVESLHSVKVCTHLTSFSRVFPYYFYGNKIINALN